MASEAPTITPSVLNTPKNGSTSQSQPPASGSQPNATAAPVNGDQSKAGFADYEAKLKAREEAIEAREKKFNNELKKNADEKRGLGPKLSRLNELEKKWAAEEERQRLRKLNPVAALEEDFGKDWATKINNLAVTGVPPADLIADALTRFEQRIDAKLAERDAKTKEQSTLSEQKEIEAARAGVARAAAEFYQGAKSDYPLFEQFGDADRIGVMVGQRVEQEFMRTGKLISVKEAADLIDESLFGIYKAAHGSEKYRSKLQPETKAANVSPSSGVSKSGAPESGVQRRTLDNSMTASTSGRAPASSDAEREARAIAVFNAVRAKGKA